MYFSLHLAHRSRPLQLNAAMASAEHHVFKLSVAVRVVALSSGSSIGRLPAVDLLAVDTGGQSLF